MLCLPLRILYPFLDAYVVRQVPADTVVPFEFSNGLLFIASILFGFTSLIIVSKEWVERRIWVVLVPPLIMIVLSGIEIGNLALGTANSVGVLLLCSAAFNAKVVSTGFTVGYVTNNYQNRIKHNGLSWLSLR